MKLKRLLTAALSAVMALSVCALPAMADDGTTTPNPVWSQDHGSITIHKYEWNGANGNYATGEENDAQLPNDTTTTPAPSVPTNLYSLNVTPESAAVSVLLPTCPILVSVMSP